MSEVETPVQTTETPVTEEQSKSLSLLAQEYFGDEFKGEVVDVPVSDDEENEVVSEDDEVVVDDEGAQEVAEVEETEETEEPVTLNAFTEFLRENHELDVTDEWFENLTLKGQVNGEERTYTIGDLKAAVQKEEAADSILQEAKSKVKEQWEEVNRHSEAVVQNFTMAASILENMEKAFLSEIEAIDMDSLKSEDPGAFAAEKVRQQEVKETLDRIKAEAAQSYQDFAAQQAALSEEQMQSILVEENEKLMAALPEWADEKIQAQEKRQIAGLLQDLGFTNDEINSASDHRLILLARLAMQQHQKPATKEVAKKKVLNIPVVTKSGPKKSQSEEDANEIKRLEKRVAQTGSESDAVALMRARRKARQS